MESKPDSHVLIGQRREQDVSWLKPHPLESRGAQTLASCANITQKVAPSLKHLSNVWPKVAEPRFSLRVTRALS